MGDVDEATHGEDAGPPEAATYSYVIRPSGAICSDGTTERRERPSLPTMLGGVLHQTDEGATDRRSLVK